MNIPHHFVLNQLQKLIKHLRYSILVGAIVLLVALLTLANDIKRATVSVTPSPISFNMLTPSGRETVKLNKLKAVPLFPIMQVVPPMAVAAYGFSESVGTTTADASGNNNIGTLLGGITRITTGKYGNGLSFDGINDVVRIPDSPTWKVNGLTGYTLSLWIKVNSVVGDYKMAIGKGAWPSDDFRIYKLGSQWQFALNTTALKCAGSTPSLAYLTTADNTYHHIALVMDSTRGTCNFYSDGQVVATDPYVSGTTSFSTGAGKNDLFIGGLDGGNQFLKSDIDDVRIYTRALPQAEIQSDMNTPVGGPTAPDTTLPVIAAVAAGTIGALTATITWTTNEPADTQVEYGLTATYGQSTTLAPALAASHSQALTGLSPVTLYHFRVKSKDAAGNLTTSGDFTFTTNGSGDATPPVISAVSSSSVTQTSAVVSWTTNEPASTQIEYGLTTTYGNTTTLDTTLALNHSQTLINLTTNTLYQYRVLSKDAAGNLATSGDFTFTTQQGVTGFQEALVTNGLQTPTTMEFAPDGRLFVTEKGGKLRVVQNGQLLTSAFFTASVASAGEQGLLGITFDPNFASNQYVYIYYTATSPSVHNRLSRLTANGNLAVPGSETVLLDLPGSIGIAHQGGAIHFGIDGKLYIAVGDHQTPENAPLLTTPYGKILRINADGSIPTDNPFYGQTTGINRAIYAIGFRNPYTFAVDPATGRIFVNDVGNNAWEEINQLVRGGNYGWPTCEGPQGTGSGTCNSSSFTYPLHAYSHSGDAAITGSVFYRGSQFPSQYVGAYFFADYTANWIRLLEANNQVPGVNNPATSFRTAGYPVDLKVGTDGSLYYLSIGNGSVSRISYGSGNRNPTAVITATPTVGTAPLVVNFSGSMSTDPDNDQLTYTWNFGDGTPTGSGVALSHTYQTAGNYLVTLTVSDGRGGQHSATVQIVIGTPPVGIVLTPGEGGFYNAGQTIQYSGSGMDAEEGSLPASAFSWTIVFHHGTHTHPFLGPITNATGGSFQIPQVGEMATNVWYRIHLKVTDREGLTHEVFRDIRPNVVTITLAGNIPGATLTLDGQPATAPLTITSVVGMQRSIGVPSPQTIGGNEHVFVSWSDSGAVTHTITTPASATTYTATLRQAAPLATNWFPPAVQIFQDFNLALPISTTTVAGLEVLLNLKSMSIATAPQIIVQLSWDGGLSWTAANSPPAPTTTEQLFIVGTASDLWGRSGWTASELTNTNFRVRITTVSASPTRDFLLDVAGVRVTAR